MKTLQAPPRFYVRSSPVAPMLPPDASAWYGLAAGVPTPPSLSIPGLEVHTLPRAAMVPDMQRIEPQAATGVLVTNNTPAPVPLPPPDGVSVLWLGIDGEPILYGPNRPPPSDSSTGRTLLWLGVAALALYALSR